MKTSFTITGISLLVVLWSRYMYLSSPNYVAEDGMLVESFGYIPLFRFAGLVFVVSLIAGIVKHIRSR